MPRAVLDLQGLQPRPEQSTLSRLSRRHVSGRAACAWREVPADTQVYRNGRPRFIDKMPNNLRHIGPHSPHAAELGDHRCAPRADGLLLREPQAALCARPGIRLQHRGHGALLPHLPRAHGALERGAARDASCECCTRRWSRTSRAAYGGSSTTADSSSSPRASSSTRPPQYTHGELRAGAPADLPARGSISGGTSSPGSGR